MNRPGYTRPVPLGELTNRRLWKPVIIDYVTKKHGALRVSGFSAPDCDDVVVDERNEFVYLRMPSGKWRQFENLYAVMRYLAHQRRKYAREIPHLEEMITNIDGMNAEVVTVTKKTLKTALTRKLRRRLEAERRKLLRVKDPLKQRALEYLTYVVKPGELSLDEDPDGDFAIDSIGRVNSGPLGTDTGASSRALRERVYVIHKRMINSAIIESYIKELILELEQHRDEGIKIWKEFCELAEAYMVKPEEAIEREIYYRLNQLQWLLARLWLSPYDRATGHIKGEISDIRVNLEDSKGRYRRNDISSQEWTSVLHTAETMLASLNLQKVRGGVERLLLPLAEGEEGALTGAERDGVGAEMDLFISGVETIDDTGFERPKTPVVLNRLRLAREEVRQLGVENFKKARAIVKSLLARDAHLI